MSGVPPLIRDGCSAVPNLAWKSWRTWRTPPRTKWRLRKPRCWIGPRRPGRAPSYPNCLEQRFGRIHRIGQTEVCHLWNLVAEDTREGKVYQTLLDKLETERRALGGQVFDVLGQGSVRG